MIACGVLLLLNLWLASGTLAPYGASIPGPYVTTPCKYLLNSDYDHLIAPFRMLDGLPRDQWDFSVVLRRILYFWIAFIPMKLLGIVWGGFLTNVVLHLGALALFTRFAARRWGAATALPAAATIALFPGLSYWGAQPYSYALIVPGALVLMILLSWLDQNGTKASGSALLGRTLLIGVLFTGYDFAAFFAPATLCLILWRRGFKWIIPTTITLLLPSYLVTIWLRLSKGIGFDNSNTATYGNILYAWVHPTWDQAWLELIQRVPKVFLDNFLFSTHLGLSLAFLVAYAAWKKWRMGQTFLELPEAVLLLTALAIFLFNNLAPPYPGWQMRGIWIPRIYQPIAVAMIGPISRTVAIAVRKNKAGLCLAFSLVLLFNASVCFGPFLGIPYADGVHYAFYKHSRPGYLNENLDRYGRRPLGICSK